MGTSSAERELDEKEQVGGKVRRDFRLGYVSLEPTGRGHIWRHEPRRKATEMSATNRAPKPSLIKRVMYLLTGASEHITGGGGVTSTDLPVLGSETVDSPSMENMSPAHNVEREDPALTLLKNQQNGLRDAETGAVDADALEAEVTLPYAGEAADRARLRRTGIKNAATGQMSYIFTIVQAQLTQIQTWGEQRNNADHKASRIRAEVKELEDKLEPHQKVGSRKRTRKFVRAVSLAMIAGEFGVMLLTTRSMGLVLHEAIALALLMAGAYGIIGELHTRRTGLTSFQKLLFTTIAGAVMVSSLALANARAFHIANSSAATSFAPPADAPNMFDELTAGAWITFWGQFVFIVLVPLLVIALRQQYRDPEADLFEQQRLALAEQEDLIHELNYRIRTKEGQILASRMEARMVALRAIADLKAEAALAHMGLAEYYGQVARSLASPETTVAAAVSYVKAKSFLDEQAIDAAEFDSDLEFFQQLQHSMTSMDAVVTALESKQLERIEAIENVVAQGFAPLQIEAGKKTDSDEYTGADSDRPHTENAEARSKSNFHKKGAA